MQKKTQSACNNLCKRGLAMHSLQHNVLRHAKSGSRRSARLANQEHHKRSKQTQQFVALPSRRSTPGKAVGMLPKKHKAPKLSSKQSKARKAFSKAQQHHSKTTNRQTKASSTKHQRIDARLQAIGRQLNTQLKIDAMAEDIAWLEDRITKVRRQYNYFLDKVHETYIGVYKSKLLSCLALPINKCTWLRGCKVVRSGNQNVDVCVDRRSIPSKLASLYERARAFLNSAPKKALSKKQSEDQTAIEDYIYYYASMKGYLNELLALAGQISPLKVKYSNAIDKRNATLQDEKDAMLAYSRI